MSDRHETAVFHRFPVTPAEVAMGIVAGVNLAGAGYQVLNGGDPFGYLNAFILAFLWMMVMNRD